MSIRLENRTETNEIIPVSTYALDKLMKIARLMEKYEFRAISITPPDKEDGVIRDFYIPDQSIETAMVNSEGIEWASDYARLDNKWTSLGVAHGHGRYDVGHSGTDHKYLPNVLEECWDNNSVRDYLTFTLKKSQPIKKNGGYSIVVPNEFDIEILLNTPNATKEMLDMLKDSMTIRAVRRVRGSVSSIVVNHTGREIHGIKQYWEQHGLIIPKHIVPTSQSNNDDLFTLPVQRGDQEYLQDYEAVKSKNFVNYRYTVNATVKEFEEDCEKITNDALLKELKSRKLDFKCGRPGAFETREAVSVPWHQRHGRREEPAAAIPAPREDKFATKLKETFLSGLYSGNLAQLLNTLASGQSQVSKEDLRKYLLAGIDEVFPQPKPKQEKPEEKVSPEAPKPALPNPEELPKSTQDLVVADGILLHYMESGGKNAEKLKAVYARIAECSKKHIREGHNSPECQNELEAIVGELFAVPQVQTTAPTAEPAAEQPPKKTIIVYPESNTEAAIAPPSEPQPQTEYANPEQVQGYEKPLLSTADFVELRTRFINLRSLATHTQRDEMKKVMTFYEKAKELCSMTPQQINILENLITQWKDNQLGYKDQILGETRANYRRLNEACTRDNYQMSDAEKASICQQLRDVKRDFDLWEPKEAKEVEDLIKILSGETNDSKYGP
jgi:hypothetical protein